ncbi:hypothetical protein ACTFIU_006203 [Dictyostelium citrinum]
MRKELNEEIGRILEEERKVKAWDIKLKLHLHQETPSKYLTSILKSRAKDKSIFQIKDKENRTISDKENIAKRFYEEKEENEEIHKKLLERWEVDADLIKKLEMRCLKQSKLQVSTNLQVKTASIFYSTTFNDFSNKKEIPSKFKEGDPISPTIFALVLEPLLIDSIKTIQR